MKNFQNSIDQIKHNFYLPGLFCTSLASQNRMGSPPALHLEVKHESRYEPEKKNQNLIKMFKSKLYLIPLGLLKVFVFKGSPSTHADSAHF